MQGQWTPPHYQLNEVPRELSLTVDKVLKLFSNTITLLDV